MVTSKYSCLHVLLMVALLVCSIFVGGSNGRSIGYEPIRGGDPSKGCKGSACLPPPQGPYGRGCEKPERCRAGPPGSVGGSNGHSIGYGPIHHGDPSSGCKGPACLPPPATLTPPALKY